MTMQYFNLLEASFQFSLFIFATFNITFFYILVHQACFKNDWSLSVCLYTWGGVYGMLLMALQ